MGTACRRGAWAVVVAAAGWLLWQPATAGAHPLLVGRWSTNVPAGAPSAYEFGPPEYVDNGVWMGCYTYFVGNYPVIRGRYELRVYVGTEGILGFREGQGGATTVGTVDLTTRVLTFRNLTYRPDVPLTK